jgi:hypothetical protein
MYDDIPKAARFVVNLLSVIGFLTVGWIAVGIFVGISIRAAKWVIAL